jgi:predicted pyridoxine 5'-phosphate oxidase superfamily flavin-nucleotide-binding protein
MKKRQKTSPGRKPGSSGEHVLQEDYGTTQQADMFYEKQMLEHLNDQMQELISRQEMVFIATSDEKGEADCSFRAGPAGFVRVLDPRTIAYPEYRGNGVHASLGNILGNPHVGMMFVDFFGSTVGLHVNGRARIQENIPPGRGGDDLEGPSPERWVVVDIQEAYIHCAKHIPKLKKLEKRIHWGTDDEATKGGDYFRISTRSQKKP